MGVVPRSLHETLDEAQGGVLEAEGEARRVMPARLNFQHPWNKTSLRSQGA
jgi:hypothetical protein